MAEERGTADLRAGTGVGFGSVAAAVAALRSVRWDDPDATRRAAAAVAYLRNVHDTTGALDDDTLTVVERAEAELADRGVLNWGVTTTEETADAVTAGEQEREQRDTERAEQAQAVRERQAMPPTAGAQQLPGGPPGAVATGYLDANGQPVLDPSGQIILAPPPSTSAASPADVMGEVLGGFPTDWALPVRVGERPELLQTDWDVLTPQRRPTPRPGRAGVYGVRRDPATPTGIPPQYHEGHLYEPAALSVEARARIQMELEQAGLIEEGGYTPGVWDAPTVRAYSELLIAANGHGLDREEMLAEFRAGFATRQAEEEADRLEQARASVGPFVAPTVLLPDLASLNADIKDLFRQRMRRDPRPDELAGLAQMLDAEYRSAAGVVTQQARSEYEGRLAATVAQAGDVEGGAVGQTFGGGQVRDVDPAARFRELFETRYAPQLDRVKRLVESGENRNLLANALAGTRQDRFGAVV